MPAHEWLPCKFKKHPYFALAPMRNLLSGLVICKNQRTNGEIEKLNNLNYLLTTTRFRVFNRSWNYLNCLFKQFLSTKLNF